jgi:lysophospholipase L1-like esterase
MMKYAFTLLITLITTAAAFVADSSRDRNVFAAQASADDFAKVEIRKADAPRSDQNAKSTDPSRDAKKEKPKPPPPPSTTEPAPRSDQGWWMKKHEQFLESVKRGDAEVIFIGDSITQGWEGGGKSIWRRWYEPRKAINLGIGGDQTQHVLWRLDHGEVDGIHPKVAVVMIGTNNTGRNTPEQIADGVKAIVEKLRSKLPKTKILLLAIFPRDQKPEGEKRRRVKAANEIIAKFDDGKTVKYLDIGDRFIETDGTISKEIMPDYLHLTSKGYRIWADAIEPTLWVMTQSD